MTLQRPVIPKARKKWRPSISLVLSVVLLSVLALPLAGLLTFRIYENELIRQTEVELIAQAAVISAVIKKTIITRGIETFPLGAKVAAKPEDSDDPYTPILPVLDLTQDEVLPRRPDAVLAEPASLAYQSLGQEILPILLETQKVTLGGFRILDPNGVVISGKEDLGLSLAEVEEVASALKGDVRSVIRLRVSKHEAPPIYSISRGLGIRLFVAMPVLMNDQVAGVVYASRTPLDIYKQIYSERNKLTLAAVLVILTTALIGFVFYRLITRPMQNLMAQTRAIASGTRDNPGRIQHYGTSEFAALSDSFLDMAEKLQSRSQYLSTFTSHLSHELKSPLTGIQGAAELLREDIDSPNPMSTEEKARFLNNILSDTQSLSRMVTQLRELAQSEMAMDRGTSLISPVVQELAKTHPDLNTTLTSNDEYAVGMSGENLKIILSHLADNAAKHGAKELTLTLIRQGSDLAIQVRDDGSGIASGNKDRIFDPFFTTRKNAGGTGMGLPIVRSILQAHDGSIELITSEKGAVFELRLPIIGKSE